MPENLMLTGQVLAALWIGTAALILTIIIVTLRGKRTVAEARLDSRDESFGLCPGCEDFRPLPSRNLLCGECWGRLTRMDQVRLVDGYVAKREGEGPRALIDALTTARRHLAADRDLQRAAAPALPHHSEESK